MERVLLKVEREEASREPGRGLVVYEARPEYAIQAERPRLRD